MRHRHRRALEIVEAKRIRSRRTELRGRAFERFEQIEIDRLLQDARRVAAGALVAARRGNLDRRVRRGVVRPVERASDRAHQHHAVDRRGTVAEPVGPVGGVLRVAGRDGDEHAFADRIADRLGDDRRRAAFAAPDAEVDDLRAVVGRIANAARHHVVRAGVRAVEHVIPHALDDLHRHDADVVGHAGDADAVVGELSDRARDVRAMRIEIDRQLVVPDEVARQDKTRRAGFAELGRGGKRHVDHPESRVDRAVVGHAEREPRVVAKRDGAKRHAAVEHRDDDVGRGAGLNVPGALHVDGGEVPLVGVHRIVGPRHRVIEVARLREFDVGPRAQRRGGGFDVAIHRDVDDVEVGRARAACGHRARDLAGRRRHARPARCRP